MRWQTSEPISTDLAVGNELEVQLHTREGAVQRSLLAAALVAYREEQLSRYDVLYGGDLTASHSHDTRGALSYVDRDLLESVTAECAFVNDLVPRMQAHEAFATDIAIILARMTRQTIYAHLRTAAASHDASACHDNIGAAFPANRELHLDTLHGVIGHLATRSVFTGAGLILSDGMYFGQKMHSIRHNTGAGFISTGFTIKRDKGDPLVEIRCSDHNLLPSAARMRIGMAKIAILLTLSPLGERLGELTYKHVGSLTSQKGKRFNKIPLDESGNLRPDKAMTTAIDVQMEQMTLFLKGQRYFAESKQLDELANIAEDVLQLGDDLRQTMKGGDLRLIADRADWAAKLLIARQAMARDRTNNIERSLYDARAQYSDLSYSMIKVAYQPDDEERGGEQAPTIVQGTGYRFRDRLGATTTAEAAAVANTPPPNTRAGIRAELIKNYHVAGAGWNYVALHNKDSGQPNVHISLPSTRTTRLSRKQLKALKNARRRS